MKTPFEIIAEHAAARARYEKPEEIPAGGIPKEAVLYIFRPETNITCGKCIFIRGGRCAVFGPGETVSPERGSCGLYIHGPGGKMPWIGLVTKIEAGYAEHEGGFQCKRCEYFLPGNSCRKVDKDSAGDTPGEIHPNACCNHWEGGA